MQISISVKQIGRARPIVGERKMDIPDAATLRDLIMAIVALEIESANAKAVEDPHGSYGKQDIQNQMTLLRALSRDEIVDGANIGKVSFGSRYDGRVYDADSAAEAAITSFEDGLYRVFAGDDEITSLDERLSLPQGARITFIRLVMLAGGLW